MKISAINRKDENTIVLHLDNGEKLFLSLEVFMKNGLRSGDEISEDRFAFYVTENRKYFIKRSAVRFLANRYHSSNELKNKLLRKKYEKELVLDVIDELLEKKLLDDYVFAINYANENIKNKLWGRNKVKSGLIQKSVKPEIIEKVISELFGEGDSEIENAIALAKKKKNTLNKRNMEPLKLKQKLITFLMSRGYNYDLIKNILRQIDEDIDDMPDAE